MLKKLFLFFLVLLCWFFYHQQAASLFLKNAKKTSVSSYENVAPRKPAALSAQGKPASLFSKALEKSERALSFLPYPPAPLEELSEQEERDFPGGQVIESCESEASYYKVRQRILETSFKYPYIRTEELIDKETGNLVARLEMVANQLLIDLSGYDNPQQFLHLLGPEALFIARISESVPLYRVVFRDASLVGLPAALDQIQEVTQKKLVGEPDYIAHTAKRPLGYGYGYQWGLWKVTRFNSFQKAYQPLINQYFNHREKHNLHQEDTIDAFDFDFLRQMPCDASSQKWATSFASKLSHASEQESLQDDFSTERGINAEDAWDIRTDASSVVVALVDSGIRYTHNNLKKNMWHNPKPDPRLHDVYGINCLDNNGDPMDHDGHGTHCAGIIGAEANDFLGTVGVAWKVQLMACKYGEKGIGTESDAINALDYAKEHHADVINCSFCFNAYVCVAGPKEGKEVLHRETFKTELSSLRDSGIIVVAAAGNEGKDVDSPTFINSDYNNKWLIRDYPACYSSEFDNIVAVTATDYFQNEPPEDREGLASFSNYGLKSVSLAAPGTCILSTYNLSDRSYAFLDGTSMAAPFVSGALALMKAEFPTYSYRELIDRLLETTDSLPTLQDKMRAGRLNLARALSPSTGTPPPPGIAPLPPQLYSLPTKWVQDPTYWWY